MKKICVICGKEFTTTRSHKKTCSDECSHVLYKQTRNRAVKAYYERKFQDPEFREKRNEYQREQVRKKWREDPEFRAKRSQYQKDYLAKKKEGKVMDN
jgi:Skp family chaperone for outer membrane proteins